MSSRPLQGIFPLSSSEPIDSISSANIEPTTGLKPVTLARMIHHLHLAGMAKELELSPSEPGHQIFFEHTDPYLLNLINEYYPNSSLFFGELTRVEQLCTHLRAEGDQLNLHKMPAVNTEYEMLFNFSLAFEQLSSSGSDQIETFWGVFQLENENAPLDGETKNTIANQMEKFLYGNETDRSLFMYRYAQQHSETSPADGDFLSRTATKLEMLQATLEARTTKLRFLEAVSYALCVDPRRAIEKLEHEIDLLQRRQNTDPNPELEDEIKRQQTRLKSLGEALEFLTLCQSAQKEQLLNDIESIENEIGRLVSLGVEDDPISQHDVPVDVPELYEADLFPEAQEFVYYDGADEELLENSDSFSRGDDY